MNRYPFGLIAAAVAVVLGGSLAPAQAQEPGVTLQRELTENRIRLGDQGEDILRGPQADLPLDRIVAPNQQSFVAPGSAGRTQGSRTLVASPFSDTQLNGVADSTSVLRQVTREAGPNSDR